MIDLKLPYNGKVKLTSPYGYRLLNGEYNYHSGIDLVGLNSSLIISPCDGIVSTSTIIKDKNNKTWEWGNYVKIKHNNIEIFLCHMSERLVDKNDIVYQGQPIGIEGNTGYSFGSHCHFECRRNGSPFNPCDLLSIYNGYGVYENEPEEVKLGHDWSNEAIKWAIKNELIKGYTSGKDDYRLEQNITREEMIVILHRFYKIFM
jgi:murein DD-endopeptidase MepM/ murein hydrolase activator NlpD